jgi:FAD dependent oxidoreductase TIGR03364
LPLYYENVEMCLIVGGGIVGTMHSYYALKSGMRVIQCEADLTPSRASVRNFGLIWVSGRKSGSELSLALRARELWGNIGIAVPGTGFRAHGSLTLALNEAELRVMERASHMPDAAQREFQLLSADEVANLEPTLSSNIVGALLCKQDAIVEPDKVLGAIREFMLQNPNYLWRPNLDVKDFSTQGDNCILETGDGTVIHGSYLVIAPGAAHTGVFAQFFQNEPLRRVRLQMAETSALNGTLTHSIADGDSLRYYPAFAECGIDNLPPQHPVAQAFNMQLLLAQRDNGRLTIGDTHEYQEPVEGEIRLEPYEYLQQVLSRIFPQGLSIRRTWDGIYSQVTDSSLYFRKTIQENIHLISGLGGRGNTLAPAVAEETMKSWGKL